MLFSLRLCATAVKLVVLIHPLFIVLVDLMLLSLPLTAIYFVRVSNDRTVIVGKFLEQ
jgi:hypothetical protein